MPDTSPTGTSPAGTEAAGPRAGAPAYAWYALGILFLVYVLNFIDRQIIAILANDIKADLGLTDADIGFLYGTAFAVFYSLFGIPLGRLADSWSRVRLLTIGLAVWSLMTAISGFARTGAQLAAARVGVGIGEATASPAAYSLISDYFPKHLRATALSIYAAGLFVGGGVSLLIGGEIVERWNGNFPGGGPMGLVGWQAAFLAVGLPGLLLAVWVSTLREPVRGLIDGTPAPPPTRPWRGFLDELMAVVPPLTLISTMSRGGRALLVNLAAAAIAIGGAWALGTYTGAHLQWACIGFGYYAVFSWAGSLRHRDPATFALIWGSPAFLCTILGYSLVSFQSYAASFWAPPFAERVLGGSKQEIGLLVGGLGALAGFLGVIIGGRVSDYLHSRMRAGRVLVIAMGLITPVIPTVLAFETRPGEGSVLVFALWVSLAGLLSSSALGSAAAITQELVMPRMRGTSTATFFLATTLIGLALGPYLAGQVSTWNGDDLRLGIYALFGVVPIGLALLWFAARTVPEAERTVVERARAAGDPG